jgi:cellulose synthase/poly-beta-1,6-N-acetylglucosamine synthase-like glycosyltransferase
VPAWNERGTLASCIHSLQKVEYPLWEAVIIAGGEDGTYEEALRVSAGDSRLNILSRGPEPKNVALSRGVEAAQHDILVLLDADSIVAPGWLQELVAPLSSSASASLGRRFPKRETWISRAEQMEDIQTFEILGLTPFYGDCSMAIRRGTLSRVGGLPSGAFSREDWELEERLRQAGQKIVFARHALLVTDRPSTFKQAYKYSIRIHRARIDGLLEERSKFLHRPAWFFGKAYFFALGLLLTLSLVISLMIYFFFPSSKWEFLSVVLMAFTWLTGRRAALGLEVYAYTRCLNWLWKIPAHILLFFMKCFTAVVVLLSGQSQKAIYQGPRAS